jgi:hypothetical protein
MARLSHPLFGVSTAGRHGRLAALPKETSRRFFLLICILLDDHCGNRLDYAGNPAGVITVDAHSTDLSNSQAGGPMREIRQALRRKQAQYAQLAKEIALLQEAEEKLREIAPLLGDSDEDDESALLVEVEDELGQAGGPAVKAASAAAGGAAPANQPGSGKSNRPVALRWP